MKEEDLKYIDFWEKLRHYIERNHLGSEFDTPRRIMEETSASYDRARALLSPKEEDDLVLHVAACEEFCMAYAFAAYEMGREEGHRKPNETFRDWVQDPDYWERVLADYDEEGNLKPELCGEPRTHTIFQDGQGNPLPRESF